MGAGDHAPYLHPRERDASGSSKDSTTTPTPWGCWSPRWPPCPPSTSTPKTSSTSTSRNKQIIRLIAKMPTLAAAAHRFSVGMPFVYPDNSLPFTSNFLSMMWKIAEPRFEADPVLARALDVLFILHADHEQNCSTTAMRTVGSSHADPYSATAAAAAALYGPRHGGANEAVIRMLTDIGSIENVESFITSVKEGSGGRLQGFGHRVYKSYDPRATIIKRTADEVFEVTGKNPLLDIALKLEEIALSDEYFTSRKLYPNVDFYSGLIYQAMGFPLEMFPVLFAIPRTAGWLAHWQEMLDQDSKIARPRQLYIGAGRPRLRSHGRPLNRPEPGLRPSRRGHTKGGTGLGPTGRVWPPWPSAGGPSPWAQPFGVWGTRRIRPSWTTETARSPDPGEEEAPGQSTGADRRRGCPCRRGATRRPGTGGGTTCSGPGWHP